MPRADHTVWHRWRGADVTNAFSDHNPNHAGHRWRESDAGSAGRRMLKTPDVQLVKSVKGAGGEAWTQLIRRNE
jgi:hypothetical protein